MLTRRPGTDRPKWLDKNLNFYRDMTEYFVKHTGKLLFPSLARDQRMRRMRIILLVVCTCLFSAGGLSVWMMSGSSSSHNIIWPELSLWQR